MSKADRDFLQSIIKARDKHNVGMAQKEVISVIVELGNVAFKAADNHLDYLIRSKKPQQLKNNGRVVTAQTTTTNRTAVMT